MIMRKRDLLFLILMSLICCNKGDNTNTHVKSRKEVLDDIEARIDKYKRKIEIFSNELVYREPLVRFYKNRVKLLSNNEPGDNPAGSSESTKSELFEMKLKLAKSEKSLNRIKAIIRKTKLLLKMQYQFQMLKH